MQFFLIGNVELFDDFKNSDGFYYKQKKQT